MTTRSQRRHRWSAALGVLVAAAVAALNVGCESQVQCDLACGRTATFILQPPLDAQPFTITITNEANHYATTVSCAPGGDGGAVTCSTSPLSVTFDGQMRVESVTWGFGQAGPLTFQLIANGQTTSQTFSDPPTANGNACGTTCYLPQQFVVAD
jgi:hypothetical protein